MTPPGNLADQRGRTVLVTGGTRGLGLATALAFARQGAQCVLTHRWGSVEDDEVRRHFAAENALPPVIVQADVGNAEDTAQLMAELAPRFDRIDVFVSNATTALVVRGLDDFTERGLLQSARGAVWPTFEYLAQIKRTWGRYPRHVIIMSSNGPDQYSIHYDFVAASKAMLEALCRYLTYRLRHEDTRINVLRTRGVRTESLDATFGPELSAFVTEHAGEQVFIEEREVADAALALCCGLFDGMRGQVITVDRGGIFADNSMRFHDERAASTPPPGAP